MELKTGFKWLRYCESGRIRRNLAGMLANKKSEKLWWIRTHVRMLFVQFILDYRKMGKFLPQCILFLQKIILNRATRPFHTKFDELRILLSLSGFEIYFRCIFTKELT